MNEETPYVASEQELAVAPETAVLSVLHTALLAAERTLIVAHGDIELMLPVSPDERTAHDLCRAAMRMRRLIHRYSKRVRSSSR